MLRVPVRLRSVTRISVNGAAMRKDRAIGHRTDATRRECAAFPHLSNSDSKPCLSTVETGALTETQRARHSGSTREQPDVRLWISGAELVSVTKTPTFFARASLRSG